MSSTREQALGVAGIFAAELAAHFPLLRLPYFWDEAGYYIPAARDFFLTGNLIPTSTLSNAHPPLPEIYLALWWKIFGYHPPVTRVAMLLVASFAVLQVYLLAKQVANRQVAVAAAICFALYPVFFAQSSLAHADLSAAALTLWGLRLYFENRRLACVVAFALAVMAKETAVVTPLALGAWEIIFILLNRARVDIASEQNEIWSKSVGLDNRRLAKAAMLLLPTIPLALWYAYHYQRTGYIFGNPEFFRYNVAATLSPMRFFFAAVQRVWQAFGHMNMWVLTLATAAAMLLPAIAQDGAAAGRRRDSRQDAGATKAGDSEQSGLNRKRIAISTQMIFLVVIVAHIVLHSLIGGAVLSRYMMPVIPLVIIVGVSTLWRRVKEWKWVVAFVCLTFIAGWFVNPPYRFAPEDNLSYADYVRLHQQAANYIAKRFPRSQVLTAWTATDELTKPYLGYVSDPIRVVQIENFSFDQIMLARQNSDYDVVLLFSTKYDPARRLFHFEFWERAHERFFGYHEDLAPEAAAQLLGGTIVMKERRNGQWVAVVELPRVRNAFLRKTQRQNLEP